jgi:hypothetical protein
MFLIIFHIIFPSRTYHQFFSSCSHHDSIISPSFSQHFPSIFTSFSHVFCHLQTHLKSWCPSPSLCTVSPVPSARRRCWAKMMWPVR